MGKRMKIDIAAFTLEGSDCWFFATNINRLFYKNIVTNEEKDCGQVPWEESNADNLYRAIEFLAGKVYLIPYKARSVAVYDTKQDNFYEMRLPNEIIEGKKLLFKPCLKYGQNIFAFGIHSRSIMIIRTTDNKMDFITDWSEKLNKYVSCPTGILSRKQIAVIDENVYLPLYYGDAVMVFNLINEIVSFKELKYNISGYSGISKIDDELVLVSKGPDVKFISWNVKNNVTEVIGNLSIDDCTTDISVIPKGKEIEIFIDKTINEVKSKTDNMTISEKIECVGCEYDKSYFWSRISGEVEVVEANQKRKINTDVFINEEISKDYLNSRAGLKEQDNFGINEFLDMI